MAKQAYVYSGTDWVPLASEVTNLSGYYTKGETDISTGITRPILSVVRALYSLQNAAIFTPC